MILKDAGPDNHHIGREITARESYTAPLLASERVGRMLHRSRNSNVLMLEYLERVGSRGIGPVITASLSGGWICSGKL